MADRLSRWTPLIFACALANFLVAQILLIGGVAWPRVSALAGPSLAMVHLVTIGWLTLLMFGALFQFIPVITQQQLLHQRLALVTLVLVELGLAAMVAGFLLLGAGEVKALLLPAGGAAVIAGVLVAIVNLAWPLARKRAWPLSARFIAAGLAFLVITILLGLCFALALTVPGLHSAALQLLAGGVEYHALAGIGGWFTLTAIGVSYELLPMFMLAPHDRGAWGTAVFWCCLGGFAFAVAAGVANPFLSAGPQRLVWYLEQGARLAILGGLILYLVDVVRLYRTRRRPQIELHNRAAVGAFVGLGLGCAWAIYLVTGGKLPDAASAFVLLLLVGWLSGLGVTQLYKIVPFLSWLSWFGRDLGKTRVPRVQDLVDEQHSWPLFALYFAGVVIATAAAALQLAPVVRLAMGLTFAATVLLAREYWRAWRAYYATRTPLKPAPLPFPFTPPAKDAHHDHDRAAQA